MTIIGNCLFNPSLPTWCAWKCVCVCVCINKLKLIHANNQITGDIPAQKEQPANKVEKEEQQKFHCIITHQKSYK